MSRDPFKPDNDRFKPGDLIRIRHEQPSTVHFARVIRVHQAYVDTPESLDRKPGQYASPFKRDCELVDRPTEDGVDFGYLALPESEIRMLRKLAKNAGADDLVAKLKAELERIRDTWRQPKADAC